jgi:hypothetical protein
LAISIWLSNWHTFMITYNKSSSTSHANSSKRKCSHKVRQGDTRHIKHTGFNFRTIKLNNRSSNTIYST